MLPYAEVPSEEGAPSRRRERAFASAVGVFVTVALLGAAATVRGRAAAPLALGKIATATDASAEATVDLCNYVDPEKDYTKCVMMDKPFDEWQTGSACGDAFQSFFQPGECKVDCTYAKMFFETCYATSGECPDGLASFDKEYNFKC